jgi:hypothetical protein
VTLVPGEDFDNLFHTFRYRVFRLETLQEYRGSGEDDAIAAFNNGARTPPPDPVQDEWEAMIRANCAAGKVMQRVHVVVEPVSDYMQFELTWAYAPNVAAGEDIRVIPIRHGRPWPDGVPRQDFWLIDADLYLARYTDDGTWVGVEHIDDPQAVSAAGQWRRAALHHAQSWRKFIGNRQALAARLPLPAST